MPWPRTICFPLSQSDLRRCPCLKADSFFPCPGFYRPKIETVSDFEPIAERVHREQMPRFAGNVLDLLPQLHDQLIKRPGRAVIVDAPDFVEQRFAGHGVAALAK